MGGGQGVQPAKNVASKRPKVDNRTDKQKQEQCPKNPKTKKCSKGKFGPKKEMKADIKFKGKPSKEQLASVAEKSRQAILDTLQEGFDAFVSFVAKVRRRVEKDSGPVVYTMIIEIFK